LKPQADLYGKYNDVCYHALHIDVSCADPALTLPDGLKDEDYRKTKPGRIPVLSELERKIRAVSRERRLLMCPFFDDYDRLLRCVACRWRSTQKNKHKP
jgi:hypothetical protein